MHVNTMIVGAGLAGTLLAYALKNRGEHVMVVNSNNAPSASSVAAGLYNPVTGRKMVKTWCADVLFPELDRTYRQLEQLTGEVFMHHMPIYRPFLDPEEQNEWSEKGTSHAYRSFVREVATAPRHPELVNDPFGGLLLQQSGYLDIPVLLRSMHRWLQENNLLIHDKFDFSALQLFNQSVKWKNVHAGRIICCDGFGVQQNPYFNWLPFSPVKGELMVIKPDYDWYKQGVELIFNRGIFIIPIGNGYYRVGSTYEHRELNQAVTAAGKLKLEKKLGQLLQVNYRVVEQKAGVRPATRDRRPIIGQHPSYPQLLIFNGMGSKGASLVPHFASHFADHLNNNHSLLREVDVERFYSFYDQKNEP